MTAIQLVSANIGRVTGRGLARNLRSVMPAWLVTVLVALLFLANTINVGADIAAMGAAAKLVAGRGQHVFTIVFALFSLTLQMFVPYRRYVRFLKWLTLALFAYPALLLMVHVDWAAAGLGLVWPRGPFNRQVVTTIVAVFGTTISPYLFFWQTAQEVEEVKLDPEAEPLKGAPRQARREFARTRSPRPTRRSR